MICIRERRDNFEAKKIIISLLVVCLIIPMVSYASNNETIISEQTKKELSLHVNGHYIKNDPEIKYFIKQNRTFVQLRGLSEELGYKVDYDEKTKDIKISLDDNKKTILLNLNSDIIRSGKINTKMDVKPILKNNRIFIPIRFCVEILGEKIEWENESNSVYIGERLRDIERENLILALKKAYPQEIKSEMNDYTILRIHEDKNYIYKDVDIEMRDSDSKEITAYQLAVGLSKDDKQSIKIFERNFFTTGDKLVPIED